MPPTPQQQGLSPLPASSSPKNRFYVLLICAGIVSVLLLGDVYGVWKFGRISRTARSPLWVPVSVNQDFYVEKDGQVLDLSSDLPTPSADAATFMVSSVDSAYAKDKAHVYLYSQIIPNANPATFIVLGRSDTVEVCDFAKDDQYLYIDWNATTTQSNLTTLTFLLDRSNHFTGYAKDKDSVYYFECGTSGPLVALIGADPNTFIPVYGFGGLVTNPLLAGITPSQILVPLGKDKNHLYVRDTVISGIDAASFVGVDPNGSYFKDKNTIYWYTSRGDTAGLFPLPDVDPATFSILPDFPFSKDKSHVYETHKVILGADPTTFTVIFDASGKPTQYEKDSLNVYYMDQKMAEVDHATFNIPNPYPSDYAHFYDAQDKNHRYSNGQIVR